MINAKQRDRVLAYVEKGKAEGARLVVGGGRATQFARGYYVQPTLFADVDNAMTIAQEEIFGPVLAVIPYGDDDDAVRIANDSPYGLSGAVLSASPERAMSVARRIRTGTMNVNGAFFLAPNAPFGGYKQSGIGRESGVEVRRVSRDEDDRGAGRLSRATGSGRDAVVGGQGRRRPRSPPSTACLGMTALGRFSPLISCRKADAACYRRVDGDVAGERPRYPLATSRPGRAGADRGERLPLFSAPAARTAHILPSPHEEYATQIARDWNVKADGAGFVTRFKVSGDFISAYDVQQAGGRVHLEYWIPAAELPALNAAIIGKIEVVAEFR